MPDDVRVGHVAGARCVDGEEVARRLTVLGVLSDADIHLVVVDHRCREDVVPRPAASQDPFGILRIAVELPDDISRRGVEAVDDAVAAGEYHLRATVDLGVGGVRPGAVENVLADEDLFPEELARVLVERDEVR